MSEHTTPFSVDRIPFMSYQRPWRRDVHAQGRQSLWHGPGSGSAGTEGQASCRRMPSPEGTLCPQKALFISQASPPELDTPRKQEQTHVLRQDWIMTSKPGKWNQKFSAPRKTERLVLVSSLSCQLRFVSMDV